MGTVGYLPTLFLGKPFVHEYLVPVLLPVTDNLLFLNQRKRGKVSTKDEPRCEKTGLRGFRPGLTQTRLHTLRSWLET